MPNLQEKLDELIELLAVKQRNISPCECVTYLRSWDYLSVYLHHILIKAREMKCDYYYFETTDEICIRKRCGNKFYYIPRLLDKPLDGQTPETIEKLRDLFCNIGK